MFELQTINLHKLGCHAWRNRAWCMRYYIKQLWVYFSFLILYDCFCIFFSNWNVTLTEWQELFQLLEHIVYKENTRWSVKLWLIWHGTTNLQTGKPAMLRSSIPSVSELRVAGTWTPSLSSWCWVAMQRSDHVQPDLSVAVSLKAYNTLKKNTGQSLRVVAKGESTDVICNNVSTLKGLLSFNRLILLSITCETQW